jgi:TP901 family phage tail tape measure protein
MADNLGKAVIGIEADNRGLKTGLKESEQLAKSTLRDIATDVAKITGLMANAVAEIGKVVKNTSGTIKTLGDDFGKMPEKGSKSVMGLISQISLLSSSLASLKLFFGGSIQAAVDFEYQMAEVATMLNTTNMNMLPKFKEGILALSETYGKANKELASSLFAILSAQEPVNEAMDILTISTKLAKLGFTDTAKATRLMIAAMKAYRDEGYDATRASNILFRIVEQGNFTFNDFVNSFGNVISTAKAGGLQLEDLGAAVSSISAMLGRANTSVSSVNGVLRALVKMTNQARDAWDLIDPSFNLAILKMEGIQGVIRRLADTTPELRALIFGTIQGFRGFENIQTAGIEDYIKRLAEISSNSDTVNNKLDRVTETAKSMQMVLKEAGENLKIAFGDSVADDFKFLLRSLAEIIKNTRLWVVENKELVAIILKVGAIFTTLLGLLMSSVLLIKLLPAGTLLWSLNLLKVSMTLAVLPEFLDDILSGVKLIGVTTIALGSSVANIIYSVFSIIIKVISSVYYAIKSVGILISKLFANIMLYINLFKSSAEGVISALIHNALADGVEFIVWAFTKAFKQLYNLGISLVETGYNYVVGLLNKLIVKLFKLLNTDYAQKAMSWLGVDSGEIKELLKPLEKKDFKKHKYTDEEIQEVNFLMQREEIDSAYKEGLKLIKKANEFLDNSIYEVTEKAMNSVKDIGKEAQNIWENLTSPGNEIFDKMSVYFDKLYGKDNPLTKEKNNRATLPKLPEKSEQLSYSSGLDLTMKVSKKEEEAVFKKKEATGVYGVDFVNLKKALEEKKILDEQNAREEAYAFEQWRLQRAVTLFGFLETTYIAAEYYFVKFKETMTSSLTSALDEFLKFKEGFGKGLGTLLKSMGNAILGAIRQIIAEVIAKKVMESVFSNIPFIGGMFGGVTGLSGGATSGIGKFASGGTVKKPSLILAGEAGKERVLSNRQTMAFEKMVNSNFSMNQKPNIAVNINNNSSANINSSGMSFNGREWVLNIIAEERIANPTFMRG